MTFTHVHLLLSRAFQTSNELWEKQDWYWKLYASLVNLKLLCKVEIIIKEVHRPHYDSCDLDTVYRTDKRRGDHILYSSSTSVATVKCSPGRHDNYFIHDVMTITPWSRGSQKDATSFIMYLSQSIWQNLSQ